MDPSERVKSWTDRPSFEKVFNIRIFRSLHPPHEAECAASHPSKASFFGEILVFVGCLLNSTLAILTLRLFC